MFCYLTFLGQLLLHFDVFIYKELKIIYIYVLNWKLGQEDTEAIRLIFEEFRLESASLFSGYCVWDYVIVVEGLFD